MRRVLGILLAAACCAVVSPVVRPAGTAAASTASTRPSSRPAACSIAPLRSTTAVRSLHRILASAGTTPVRLLALGSSTTYGMDLTNIHDRWPDRLMAGLAKRGIRAQTSSVSPLSTQAISKAGGALMVDGAVPGATAETSLAEYAPGLVTSLASGNTPRIVFQMIGANDYWAGIPPTVYGAGLRLTTAALSLRSTPPIEVYVSDFRDPATTNPKYPWSAYVAQMRKIVAEDPAHRILVDLTPWFDRAQVPGKDPHGYLDSGGVHPSVAGQAMIAKLILRKLRYGC